MKQLEELENKETLNNKKRNLTHEENMKIMTYPQIFQDYIAAAAENSEDSVEEIWEDMKGFENML